MVVVDESGWILELLLASTTGNEAFEDYLFKVFVCSVPCKGQLANNCNSLTVLLYLCDELADVLVLERKRIHL